MRPLTETFRQLPASAESGLPDEAVARSRQLFGANRLTPLPREPLWKKFLEKFDEPIIKILLAAALLSMFVDLFQDRADVAGIALGVVAAAAAGLAVLRQLKWLPSLMFVSAVILFLIGLSMRDPDVE